MPIQPKTSSILLKFCRSAVVSPDGAGREPRPPRRARAAAREGDDVAELTIGAHLPHPLGGILDEMVVRRLPAALLDRSGFGGWVVAARTGTTALRKKMSVPKDGRLGSLDRVLGERFHGPDAQTGKEDGEEQGCAEYFHVGALCALVAYLARLRSPLPTFAWSRSPALAPLLFLFQKTVQSILVTKLCSLG